MLKYLFCGLQVFLFSSTFIFLHTHTRSQPLNHVPARLNLNWQCQESKILKKDFRSVIGARKKNRKKKDRNKCLWDLPREETPLPSGGSSLSSDLLKAAVFECLRIHLIHFFLQWSDCVPGKKKPLYVHMTKQYSIADHIWPWNLPALQSCIHVSALRLQHVHLAFIYLSGLKSALNAPYTSQIKVSKIHRIWGAGRKKGNCK